MNRRDALKVFTLGGTLTAAAAEASRALGDMPEERDLGGCTRLVRIYVAGDDAPKGTPIIAIESVDMFPIELVTKIEMELDAKDMVFHGYMTRIAHDEFSRDAQAHRGSGHARSRRWSASRSWSTNSSLWTRRPGPTSSSPGRPTWPTH